VEVALPCTELRTPSRISSVEGFCFDTGSAARAVLQLDDPTHDGKWQRTRAASPDGCTAAILMARGFKSDVLVELINGGHASVTTERVTVGDREMEVTRVQITNAGRHALEQPKARR
jgi:hypothetical protein